MPEAVGLDITPKNQLHGSQKSLWVLDVHIPGLDPQHGNQVLVPKHPATQHPIPCSIQSLSRHRGIKSCVKSPSLRCFRAFYVRRTGSVDAEFCSHTYKATRSESPGRSVQGQQLEVPKCPKNQIQIQLVVCNML